MKYSSWICASLSLVLCAASVGCDPGGAGASGVISLGANVTTEGFTLLKLCAAPEAAEGAPSSGFPETCELTNEYTLSEVTFPHEYEIKTGVGTTDHERWRLVIWLTDDEKSTKPVSGEPFGLTVFAVGNCAAGQVEEFCGVTAGVDVTLTGGKTE